MSISFYLEIILKLYFFSTKLRYSTLTNIMQKPRSLKSADNSCFNTIIKDK